MYKKSILALFIAIWSWAVVAEGVALRPGHPQTYVVKQGDTLWGIAGAFLSEPWQWQSLWRANPRIRNPHLIYPGDVLNLTYVGGRPYLTVSRGRNVNRGRNVKLSPSARSTPHDQAIPPIPLDAIRPFLSRPRVMSRRELALAPYVISSQDQHLMAGAGDRIYLRGITDTANTRYTVLRQGQVYRDGGAILGYEALQVADAVIERFGDPATAYVTQSNREVLAGDRLLPVEHTVYPQFVPHAPERPIDGRIISVVGGVSQIGRHQVVVLNRGAEHGLEPGHVLAIYQSGQYVRDTAAQFVELPTERVGDLMVFRPFDRISYALVMHTERPAHVYDAVRDP